MTSLPIRAFVSATRPRRGRSITQWAAPHRGKRPPNMRLKLAGAVVLRETGGSCPGGLGASAVRVVRACRALAASIVVAPLAWHLHHGAVHRRALIPVPQEIRSLHTLQIIARVLASVVVAPFFLRL